MKALRLTVFLTLLFSLKAAAQVPLFDSYAPAAATLFLDFDGHRLVGTNWNIDGPLYCGPSNLNATQITEIYNRIAEDYRPFNINVTTDSTVYEAAPIDQRMRVVFTITSEWYGVAGGVAYTNSFTWGNNTPCFVFTALHKYNVKNIAEAGSHEAGHTFGLRHQAMYDTNCAKVTDYNTGSGSGIAGWAPIMGVGYYRNTTTWHNGPNPYGCTNAQDDLAIITKEANGFGYRPDDNTATNLEAATKLVVENNVFSSEGLISTNTDTDLFQIAMPAPGALQVTVQPYSIAANDLGSNLDVEVQLYNKEQTLLRTFNPTNMLSAAIDTTLPSGDYYLSVSGASNPFSSNYASLGAYTIKGAVPVMKPLPLRTLQLRGTAKRWEHQLTWLIDADEAVTEQILERSEDGQSFVPVATLQPDSRTYTTTYAKGAQYRLQVRFDNGRQYYSNIIAVAENKVAKPQLYTTVIHTNTVTIASPANFAYVITDITGKQLSKGQLQKGKNEISMGFLKTGLYLVSFEKDGQRFVEKFIRQ